jgi:hypothetical protein
MSTLGPYMVELFSEIFIDYKIRSENIPINLIGYLLGKFGKIYRKSFIGQRNSNKNGRITLCPEIYIIDYINIDNILKFNILYMYKILN